METDYKIVQFKENDDGSTMARVRYYVGETVPVEVYNRDTDEFEIVNQYRRTDMYEEIEYYFE